MIGALTPASSSAIPPEPTPPVAPTYTWLGCDLVTGLVVDELPVVATGPLSSVLGAYTSATAALIVPDAPPTWDTATTPGRSLLVCLTDDGTIQWGGMVLGRRGGSADTVELRLATCEAYFDRRYVKDHQFIGWDEADIALELMFDANDVEGIGLDYDYEQTGTFRDREYHRDSDQTIYSQLTELMGVENGPEWTIELAWQDVAQTRVAKVFIVRERIGAGSALPTAVFDLPGCVKSYDLDEDFTSGKGANHIEMFGDGEGDSRPATPEPIRDEARLAAGWPRYEYRATRSGVIHPTTLTRHATQALAWMKTGAQIHSVTADATTAPQLGRDWRIGDDVRLSVESSPRHPAGLDLVGRALGWELELGEAPTITPLLETAGGAR